MSRESYRRGAARLVLVAWICGVVLPAIGPLHPTGVVDVACGDILLAISHPVTQLETVRLAPVGDHCAVCHLVRAARGAFLFSFGTHGRIERSASVRPARTSRVRAASLLAVPSRAPPVVTS
jgi:hypothetical protein